MQFVAFDLERWQSQWEHRVRFNLSESGVDPLTVRQLLNIAGVNAEELEAIPLGYSQSDGSDSLRETIAALYEGATQENVMVTVGSSEANFISCWTVIEPGDRVVTVSPLYRQTWGLAQNLGATVVSLNLRPELDWQPDPTDIERVITPDTKLIIVINPNNPTGRILTEESRSKILDCARGSGAWLLADEVYQGAELGGNTTPSFWGTYERVIVVNGLSKAYGLPGLRIGWIVAPAEFKQAVYKRHDYTVICPTAVSDYLTLLALRSRDDILSRTRAILRRNYPVLDEWLQGFDGAIERWKPDCGAISFVRYRQGIDALDLVERIRQEQSILLVPGDHFGLSGCLRFGFGNATAELRSALSELEAPLKKLLLD